MSDDGPPDILQALYRQAQTRPQAEALVAGERRLDFASLWRGAGAIARRLRARGVRTGDRVVLQRAPDADWVQAWFGIWRCGAVAAPLSHRLPEADARARVAELAAAAWLRDEPWPTTDTAPEDDAAPTAVPPSQLAAILYTSGTQARPKGVMLDQAHFAFSGAVLRDTLGLRTEDRVLCLLPLHHTYGLSQLMAALPAGAAVVLEPAPAWPAVLLQRIAGSGCTVLPATPTLVAQLAALREPSAVPVPAWRAISVASDALPPERLAWLRRTWPALAIWPMYGQTECGRASILDAALVDRLPGSVGRGLPGTQVWLRDPDGRRIDGPGRGELVVQGPHRMRGYWQRPEETAAALGPDPDGGPEPVLHTGDLARRDADGWLWIEGRLDDLIQCRGERVGPREIEAVLLAHPDVTECAVVGRPDAALGQRIEAHVVLRPGAAADVGALSAHLRTRLEPSRWPQRIQFHAALPKTELGKLARGRLPHDHAERADHAPPAGPDPSVPPGQLPPAAGGEELR